MAQSVYCFSSICSSCRVSRDLEALQDPVRDGEVEVDVDSGSLGPLVVQPLTGLVPLANAKATRKHNAKTKEPYQNASVLAASPRREAGLQWRSDSSKEQEPAAAEVQICPVSGLSTLEGVCPFAKPNRQGTQPEASKRKLRLKLDFQWENAGTSFVSVQVRPCLTEYFEVLGIPDTSSSNDIRQRYLKLAKQHHPDRNRKNAEAAKQLFQKVEKAYEALKDTNGELAFPWDQQKESQRTMTGDEAVRTLGKLGVEAWDAHHLEALQLRHMVRQCPEIRLLVRKVESGIALSYQAESWIDALCVDPNTGSEHLVKMYRRDRMRAPEAGKVEGGS